MNRWNYLLGFSSLAVLSAGAHAEQPVQEAPGVSTLGGLEEIVVTARRRTESLLNVPVAVTAISQQAMERALVRDLTQIGQMTPNVIVGGTSNGAAIVIRGVGTAGFDAGLEQSVAFNIDGVTMGRSKLGQTALFDVQQVEVLKGPQALFFGKNSPAGVISVTTADPTREFAAMGRAGYEFEAKEKYVEGFVSGPISESLLFRLAGRVSIMDGWIKNTAANFGPNLAFPGQPIPARGLGTSPANKVYSGRATLKWMPTDDFSATLKFTGSRLDTNTDSANESYCAGPALALGRMTINAPGVGAVVDQASDCKLDQKRQAGGVPTAFLAGWPEAQRRDGKYWFLQDTYLGSLALNYTLGNLQLTSVTGYTKLVSKSFVNADNTSFAAVVSAPTERARSWSEELRVASNFEGPLNFTFGGFYESTKRTNGYNAYLGFAGFDPANNGSMYTFRNLWHVEGKTYSAFGQLRWKLFENTELTGGVRYTKEKRDTDGVNLYINALGRAFGLATPGLIVAQKTEFSNWSPEITISHKPTRELMIYGSFKTGFKSGGLSTPATLSNIYVANPGLLAFKPERSKGFEGGIKGELFGRKLRFDITAYRYTFSDLQLPSFNAALVAYFITNAGKARTTGIESSVVWQATDELKLHGSASYNKAKFVSFSGAQCYALISGTPLCPLGSRGSYDRSGQSVPRAPKYTLAIGFDYEREMSTNLKVGLSGEANRTGHFQSSELGDPSGIVDGFWKLDAGIRVGAVDDKWEVALLGRNLTNEYYPIISSDKSLSAPGNLAGYTVRPRQIAIQTTVRF